jgi:hypothetical protein
MKEFMLIFIGGDYEAHNLSPEEIQQQMGKWFAWIDELKKEDLYVDGKALQPTAKHRSGKDAVITDGPYADAKEIVGGYFVVKAKDFDHALELAKGYPDYDYSGGVEVREVVVF